MRRIRTKREMIKKREVKTGEFTNCLFPLHGHFIFILNINKSDKGLARMAQWLNMFSALVLEYLGSVPGAHIAQLTTISSSSSRRSDSRH